MTVEAVSIGMISLTSPMSSPRLGTVTTTVLASRSTVNMVTKKPYEQFLEVQVSDWIDRICIPTIVGIGVLGNFLCFITLVFTSLRTTSTCVYMAVIAVLDSVILVVILCGLIRQYLGYAEFYMNVDWTCGLQYFLFFFSVHFDVLVILAMTVDRFIVVRFPLKAQSWCTPKSAIKVITAAGAFSFALNFQILFTHRLVPSGNAKDPLMCWYLGGDVVFFMTKIYTVIDACIYSFIPVVFLLTLNFLIIRELSRSRKFSGQFVERQDRNTSSITKNRKLVPEDTSYNSDANASNSALRKADLKSMSMMDKKKRESFGDRKMIPSDKQPTSSNITLMLLLVSFGFLLLTSPTVILLLYKRYKWLPKTNEELAHKRLAHAVVDNLMYTNHAINFLFYCISGRRFRLELKRLVTRICYCL